MKQTYKYNLVKGSSPSFTFQSDDSQKIIDVLETFFCEDCLQEGFNNALDNSRDLKDNDEYIDYLLSTRCGAEYLLEE
ncbi:MAG: hypothetical protein CMH22_05060 [Methylophaga sp.]|nr:hypothetical protein [Methylophaga sp.]MAX51326.1 hypothetical protein [Methylophaga sp.]|tara:strand:- start:33975 stop:34208 length:234 start_codon:yes stop_codon:yes gene_type:complete